jgi:hypothetical protein
MGAFGRVCLACCTLVVLCGTSPAFDAQQRRRQDCAQVALRLQRLDARMRTGYSAREAQHLWDQRRRLNERRWTLRCNDFSSSN